MPMSDLRENILPVLNNYDDSDPAEWITTSTISTTATLFALFGLFNYLSIYPFNYFLYRVVNREAVDFEKWRAKPSIFI